MSSIKLYYLRIIIPLCTLLILDQKDQNTIYIHPILLRHQYTIYMISGTAKIISPFIRLAVHISMLHLSGTSRNHSSAPCILPNSSKKYASTLLSTINNIYSIVTYTEVKYYNSHLRMRNIEIRFSKKCGTVYFSTKTIYITQSFSWNHWTFLYYIK